MAYYSETSHFPPPSQRKFNGDYGFPFKAAAGETEAGTLILRGGLVGFSNRPVELGEQGTAELQGTITLSKASGTTFLQGDPVAYNFNSGLCVVSTTVGAYPIGVCKIEPSADAVTVEVLLNYVPTVAVSA
jgi:predicted RecA/RadA family phage recombinase